MIGININSTTQGLSLEYLIENVFNLCIYCVFYEQAPILAHVTCKVEK